MTQDVDPPTDPALAWGGPSDLSAWEALMWRTESDPRTSSSGFLVELLAGEPTWERFVETYQRTVSRIPRLRERVVEPPLPVVQPAWSGISGFDVTEHLRHACLNPDQSLDDLCEALAATPLDLRRPPWEATLVTGLPHGQAAHLFRVHHSLTDGLGLMQLLELAHEDSGDLRVPLLVRPSMTPTGLLSSRLSRRAVRAPGAVARSLISGGRQARRRAQAPREALRSGVGYAASLRRMIAGPSTAGSATLSDRTTGSRYLTFDVDLADLRKAARAAGGSVNDAFVAAVLGGVRRFHEAHGSMVDTIPLALPVSLRSDQDPLGGNRFAAARIAAPLAQSDPVERIRSVREAVLSARAEPALGFLDHVSPILTRLPTRAIIELSAGLTSASDLQVSNIRGLTHRVQLAGHDVLRTYALGPRPGVAAMVAMVTYDGTCCIGFTLDPRVFSDRTVTERCLREGFDEVLAGTAITPTDLPGVHS
jgi:diacylglycerol O-acyltransferase